MCKKFRHNSTIFPRPQDLRARIYDPQLQVVAPNLTFAQENTLRGIHMCDIFNATSAESFRYRTENAVRLFRTTAENAYNSITVPGISSCPYGNRFYGACSTSMRPQVSPSSIYGCNVTRQNSSVYSSKETGHWEPTTCINTLTGTSASCPHYSTASLWR